MATQPKVSPEEWEAARQQLLVKEKDFRWNWHDEYGDTEPSQ